MRSSCILSIVLTALVWPAHGLADHFTLDWYTFDGGGALWTTGGTFELSGTIGQPDASVIPMTGGTFELVGGFWPVAALPPACPGDCNCDGRVDFGDINPFVAVLGGAAPCSFENCDINGDGVINFGDINPFVALLSGGGGPCP